MLIILYQTINFHNRNMAATDEKVPVIAPTIAAISTRSSSKPVRRSARNLPQRKEDYSGTAALANKKWDNHENEVSNQRGVTIVDTSPATSTEVPPTAAVEDESGTCGEERVRKNGGARRKKQGRTREEVNTDESIKCFCESKQVQGDIVRCEVCSGGFHLKCMGMKEGTYLLKGKEFVCHLCVSSVILKMREEIVELRKELEGVRKEMKSMVVQNALLQEQLVYDRVLEGDRRESLKMGASKLGEWRQGCREKQNTVVKESEKQEGGKEGTLICQGEEDGGVEDCIQARPQGDEVGTECQAPKVGKKVSSRQGVSGKGKQITRVSKIWGTKKGVSCNDVAKAMVKAVGRVSSSFSVSKRTACVKGKNKWWVVVKAPEQSLQILDKKWDHEFWQWQKLFRS